MYSEQYIPILLTACNNIIMKNMIKCLNQLNQKTILGNLFSFNGALIQFSLNRICCLLFIDMTD